MFFNKSDVCLFETPSTDLTVVLFTMDGEGETDRDEDMLDGDNNPYTGGTDRYKSLF